MLADQDIVPGNRLLDVACGTGPLAISVTRAGVSDRLERYRSSGAAHEGGWVMVKPGNVFVVLPLAAHANNDERGIGARSHTTKLVYARSALRRPEEIRFVVHLSTSSRRRDGSQVDAVGQVSTTQGGGLDSSQSLFDKGGELWS